MREKKKIGIIGLLSLKNFGEQFLIDCTNYLTKECVAVETELFDLESQIKVGRKVFYYFLLVLSKLCFCKKISYQLMYIAVRFRCRKAYQKIAKEVDGLIIAAGSFKYGTQKLWAYYCVLIEVCEKEHVPLMFSAMNIQSYDGKDWRCIWLKKHINMSCVKVFTTRDGKKGIEKIRQQYITNGNLIIDSVGDTALWMQECYGVKPIGGDKIGINLINGNIFVRYGGILTENQLLSFYNKLLRYLDEQKIKWEIFTNGLHVDYAFGKKLLNLYGNEQVEIKCPNTQREYLNCISEYKAVMGGRFHACIAAYSLDIPFVALNWDEKFESFFTSVGRKEILISEGDILGKNEIYHEICEILLGNERNSTRNMDKKERHRNRTKKNIELFVLRFC